MRVSRTVPTLLAIAVAAPALAVIPDHPIITEVYTDPPGASDGPVGRDLTNQHQEYIEIYLPPAANLRPGLSKDALRLAFYEVEGDADSSGPGFVNYRFDLPTFDLDPSNGTTVGAVARPASGVVVLGWLDYVGNPPTALAGTTATRLAMINGGVTSTSGFLFIPMNGNHFGGTTNFTPVAAESFIDLPGETASGIIQNGSAAYLLVNRDDVGYVQLYDDQHVPVGGSANPNLFGGNVLRVSSVMDGFACNDDSRFDVLDQPNNDNNQDLWAALGDGGAFSNLVCQLPENETFGPDPGTARGYARRFVDVAKTTEVGTAADDDPIADALSAYRSVRNDGPFFPTPGRAALTTTAPELGVASAPEQLFSVLAGTTGRPGVLCANVGGSYGINITAAAGVSSDATVATYGPGDAVSNVQGQSFGLPTIAISATAGTASGATATSTVAIQATNTVGGQPAVANPTQSVLATVTILDPTTGLDAIGQPFQTTVFVAVQPVLAQAGVVNEIAATSFGQWAGARLGGVVQESLGNGAVVLNAATDISNPLTVQPLVREFPDPIDYVNPPGPPARLDLVETVLNSAEVQAGRTTYDEVFNLPLTALRSTRINMPDMPTDGGTFSPTERVWFADPTGVATNPRSGLANATTTRTFELAIVDTNVRLDGTLETGATDDFGIVVEALEVEPGSPIVPGEFVFVSFTGGTQGADIDSLEILPGQPVVATILYLDLDNLHTVLGIRTIEQLWLVDAGGPTNEIDPLEGFSLNHPPTFSRGDTNCDGNIDFFDIDPFLLALFDLPTYVATHCGGSISAADVDASGAVDFFDIDPFLGCLFASCP